MPKFPTRARRSAKIADARRRINEIIESKIIESRNPPADQKPLEYTGSL